MHYAKQTRVVMKAPNALRNISTSAEQDLKFGSSPWKMLTGYEWTSRYASCGKSIIASHLVFHHTVCGRP